MTKQLVLALILVFCLALAVRDANAQESEVVYRPGDTFAISVTFSGRDAGEIVGASMAVARVSSSSVAVGQETFQTSFGSSVKQTGPNTFEIFNKIQANQASGEYQVIRISVTLTVGAGDTASNLGFDYGVAEFPPLKIRIENPNTAKKPALGGVTVVPQG